MASTTGSLPNHTSSNDEETIIETPFLIAGAGPAGASLACFLAQHGLKGIMIAKAPGTSKEPRAHITNPAALECMRDIDLEEECLKNSTSGDCMTHTRWCRSMAGEEWARIHSWGNQPDRQGEYEAMSPCRHVDLPQTLFEPIVVKYAINHGWTMRFDTAFVKFERDSHTSPITSTVQDTVTGRTYKIRSKYLFGCDGAQSPVMKQLDIPLKKDPGQGLAINLLIEADLSKHIKYRTGNLHWVFTPDVQYEPWEWACLCRMVRAWHEWMFIIIPQPGFQDFRIRPTNEQYMKRAREIIGDDSIPIKILDVAKWYINEIVAERYSDGNIFCLGDAVHRHPPFNGLGSNTCVQDAYNLAWKLAYVENGLADPGLLDTFSLERQPIGEGIIRRANQGLRDHGPVYEALGVLPENIEERKKQHGELAAPTKAGRERRRRLQEAIKYTEHEFGGIGQEMNQWYESAAIYKKDEKTPRQPEPEDKVLTYQITTYPGSKLPHAWLNKRTPSTPPISTQDLAGKRTFCLLTGLGGEAWREAAYEASRYLGITINVYSIGWQQDWEDVYGDWARRREVEEDGCVLLRPDRTVCWRSMDMRADAKEQLLHVLRVVLGKEK
jgi:2-polyprenyl-6-methoxyphenol hydroxylase-like FAD-dependent oxidoreductase